MTAAAAAPAARSKTVRGAAAMAVARSSSWKKLGQVPLPSGHVPHHITLKGVSLFHDR